MSQLMDRSDPKPLGPPFADQMQAYTRQPGFLPAWSVEALPEKVAG